MNSCTYSGEDTKDEPCGRPSHQRVQLKDASFEPGFVCPEHFRELLDCGDYVAVCNRGHVKRRLPSGRLTCSECQKIHNRRWMERKVRA